MLQMRKSQATTTNRRFSRLRARNKKETNLAWLARARADEDGVVGVAGDVMLLGGTSVADFRIRVAQSHARHDVTPSYWSLIGVLSDPDTLLTAPLWPIGDASLVPPTNGIQALPLTGFDDPLAYPNIALIQFPTARGSVVENIGRLKQQRTLIDLPTLMLTWLGFVWGAGSQGNPLIAGFGLPSAVLVETAFAIAEVELTPGLASASSCPEAIWQAAKWWHQFYERPTEGGVIDTSRIPFGRYVHRQSEASYRPPEG